MICSTLKEVPILLCLTCILAAVTFGRTPLLDNVGAPVRFADSSRFETGRFVKIVVNGRTLTGPNSEAERRDGRIQVPVMAIARSLGDAVSIDISTSSISVRRQSGTMARFSARLRQVSENGAVVLTVSNIGEIVFTPNPDSIVLPVEIVAALFDVSIRYDSQQNSVLVSRGEVRSEAVEKTVGRSFAELYQIDYDYAAGAYSTSSTQTLNLTAAGRLADGRFRFYSNSTSSSFRRPSFRNASFTLERPNGQRYTAGDFGTGTGLGFFSSNIRGGMASVPFASMVITAFAGRANSGVISPLTNIQLESDVQPLVQPESRFRYDTGIYGAFATKTFGSASRANVPMTLTAGVMGFSGPLRSGELISGNTNFGGRLFRFQGDVALGRFSTIRSDGSRSDGSDLAVDIAGSFQVTSELSVQARLLHIGAKFLSPQVGLREPIDVGAAGVQWTPRKWLSTSFNAGTSRRLGEAGPSDRYATVAFGITPGGSLPKFYFSHTESSSRALRNAQFSVLNASKEFGGWRLYLNATRINTVGTASYNALVGANFNINEKNSIEASQGIGSRNTLNGQFDWRTSGLIYNRLILTAGGGYNYSGGKMSTFERVTASLTLPRQTSVQLSYVQTIAGPTVLLSIRGSLFKRREANALLNSSIAKVNSLAKLTGRVYQDVDLNGRFDPGIDRPQADVQVRVDGNRYAASDPNGLFTFDSIDAGGHRVYVDLLSVRADLTMLDGSSENVTLRPGRETAYDFRLVRTGRIAGRVWLDTNGNGKFDDGEMPLSDVRVVTGSNRDTLTDVDGFFVIGDLPPGEHVVLIDAKTLPEKTMPQSAPLSVKVAPGRETGGVALAAIDMPADVKRFPAKTKE